MDSENATVNSKSATEILSDAPFFARKTFRNPIAADDFPVADHLVVFGGVFEGAHQMGAAGNPVGLIFGAHFQSFVSNIGSFGVLRGTLRIESGKWTGGEVSEYLNAADGKDNAFQEFVEGFVLDGRRWWW